MSGRKFMKNPAVSRRFPAISVADWSRKGLGLVEDDKLVLLRPVSTKMAPDAVVVRRKLISYFEREGVCS
ncbi:unnamed protein product [Prunus armeniaca]